MLDLFYFLSFSDAFKITCNGNCVARGKAWGYRVQGFLKPLVCDPEVKYYPSCDSLLHQPYHPWFLKEETET